MAETIGIRFEAENASGFLRSINKIDKTLRDTFRSARAESSRMAAEVDKNFRKLTKMKMPKQKLWEKGIFVPPESEYRDSLALLRAVTQSEFKASAETVKNTLGKAVDDVSRRVKNLGNTVARSTAGGATATAGGVAGGGGGGGGGINIPPQIRNAANSFGEMTKSIILGNTAVNLMKASFRILGNTIKGVINTILRASNALVDFADKSIYIAGRYKQLEQVAELFGRRNGMASEETRELIQAIRDLGIEGESAANLVTRLHQNHLDLSKSTELARVAQDAAAIGLTNSSDAMDRLIRGIETGHSLTLKTIGININFEESYRKYAKTIGKSTSMLSEHERMQARLNAILEYGINIQGAYEKSMENAVKIMGSMPRVVNEIQEAIGEPFQGAFDSVAKTVYELLKAFRSMVREGGTLRPALEALGDTAEGLAYIFRDLFFDVNDEWTLKPGIQTVTEQINDWLSQIEQKTADFLTWGGNLIINFAQGMILGANEGILMAIDYINSILDFWFKPGSPPRVSPDIDVYGAMTMNEYFKGFTKADFNILSSLRTPIRNLIKEMFDAEKIGADAANKLYRSLILDLSKAIKSGDFENVLNRLRRTFGDLGYEMSVLARVQLELGEAMNELARAQARLDEANRRLTQSEADVNRVMAEFNLLAKKGASEKVLDQKRKEYYQSIKNRKEARKAVKESEREVETAEERVDKLEEQVAVQKELLETLMDLRKEHFKVKVSLDTSGVSGGIKEIEDSLKSLGREIKGTPGTNKLWADEQEKSPIEQAWDELKKRWEEDIVPIFEEMQTNFETLETTVQPLKDEFREMFRPITEFLEENGDNLTTLIGTLTGVATISGLTTMVVLASSFAVAVRGIGSAWDWYKEKLAESDRKWAVVKQKQKDGLDDLKWFFKDTWDTIASLIKEKLTETDNNWDGSLLRKKTSLITFKFEFQRFLDNMKLRLKIFLYTWTTKWQERIDGALETIQTFGDGAKKVWDAVKDRAVTRFNEIKGKIVEAINKVITLLNKISLINIPTIGWSTGTGGWVPHHASGTNGWENVPQGFPNDSYPIMVESGERYMVQTPAQARAYDAIIAGLVSGASKGSSVYNTRQANYNLTVNTQADVPTVQGGFNMLGAVVGVSP